MYFELDDIKRRHSPYFDVYNAFSWIATPENNLSWNYQRGAMAGVLAAAFNETQVLFTENAKLLLKHYERPKGFNQTKTFINEIFKMDNFRKGLKNRLQYAFVIGSTDIAARYSVYRYCNSGWYRPFGSVEVNFYRRIPPALFAALATCWISVPFDIARMAYYADRTFPQELQKGYTSYLNALRRIPFEEGPYFLFKNCFPLLMRNFFQTATMMYSYDWLKDKFGTVTFRMSDFPYALTKSIIAFVSVYFACVFSYPFAVTIKEMVDLWPKEKGGVCTFQGNYRKAAVWLWYHDFGSNYFPGFMNNYFWRQAPWMFTSLWIADKLGMFTYWSHDPYAGIGNNTWEDVFS
jgi:solute carrier family 25 oxoglutarate transporter 11